MSQGKQVSQEEHEQLLEKMQELRQQKNILVMQKATAEEVIKELKTYDEVVVALKNDSILRIRPNVVYINGILADHVEPTSDEPGSEYIVDYDTKKWVDVKPNWVFPEPRKALRTVPVYTNTPVSNSFTGQQRFKQILQKYLD